jgi:GTP-binding protein
LWTLLHLKYRKHVIADDGKPGGQNGMTGASAKDIVLEVPLGTVAKDAESGEYRCEITEDGQEVILTPGGRGGLGNIHFKTSTHQAPRYAQPGEAGIEEWIVLELKVLADVGLVGFPNAGKSTLLSVISAAKPEIANYPFTTLVPNLGVVKYRDDRSFIVADIPGIIEGAAEGKGLGIRFLRHIERNSVLLFLIAADEPDVAKAYQVLLNELEKYNPELLDKERILAISKADLIEEKEQAKLLKKLPKDAKKIIFSSVTGFGIDKLKDTLWSALQ